MLKKFLAFIGLSSVVLEDGKASIEMTEEQMEASGLIISERDEAVAKLAELKAEIESEREQNVTAQTELQKTLAETEKLKAEINRLKDLPGASTVESIVETDGKTDPDAHVVDDSKDFDTNYEAVGRAFGFEI